MTKTYYRGAIEARLHGSDGEWKSYRSIVEETILAHPEAVLAQPVAVLAQARVGGARGDLSWGWGCRKVMEGGSIRV